MRDLGGLRPRRVTYLELDLHYTACSARQGTLYGRGEARLQPVADVSIWGADDDLGAWSATLIYLRVPR